MTHLASRGIICPQPLKNRSGEALSELAGRPAVIINFLEGIWPRKPNAAHCAGVGQALAKMHLAGRDFADDARQRAVGVGLASAVRAGRRARRRGAARPARLSSRAELDYLESGVWPSNLPQGVIHADLFPDNVFFLGEQVSGLIDFTFACNDMLAYDVAICLNAWCFESDCSFNVTKARAFLNAYGRERQLTEAEQNALPLLARGAALRFLLTRLVDFLNVPAGRAGAAEGSAGICPQAALPAGRRQHARLRRRNLGAAGVSSLPRVTIHTDGACSGNPGPGRLGRDPEIRRRRKGIEGRRGAHHQQPHGADGGDLGAGSAEEALHRRSLHRQPVCPSGHHRLDPWLEEERLAHRGQEAGQECRPLAAARCRAAASTRCAGTGSRATPATTKTSAPTSWRAKASRWRG